MTADADDRAPESNPAADPDGTGFDATAADEGVRTEGVLAEGDNAESDNAESANAESAQSELDLGVLSTGSVSVDRALAPLDGLTERDVSGHAEVFEQVLDELAQTMTEPTTELDPPGAAEPGVPPASR